jgi:hypothetical protein
VIEYSRVFVETSKTACRLRIVATHHNSMEISGP